MPDLFRSSFCYDPSAFFSPSRAHINNITGAPDHIQVMLDDDNRGPLLDQRLKYGKERPHIQRVKADGRLIENENRVRLAFSHLFRQL